MADYSICKDFNPYYFNQFAGLTLIIPAFFEENSEEGKAVAVVSQAIDTGNYDGAIKLVESAMKHFGPEQEDSFLTWQVYAYYKAGKTSAADFVGFFDAMEQMFPEHAFVNFDKAFIHVADGNFNAAVKELDKALEKDALHGPSLILQFLILYFARDNKWRPLFEKIKPLGLFNPAVINLVSIVELINSRKPCDIYEGADTKNLESSNKTLLEQFPDLVMGKDPQTENILLVAAESNYFRDYVVPLILSLHNLKDKDFGLHVHLYHPLATDVETLEKYADTYPDVNLSYSYEKLATNVAADSKPYYASMRFVRAYQLLKSSGNVKHIAITDADVLARDNVFKHHKIGESDVTISHYKTAPCWDQYPAGFSCFSNTPYGIEALGHIANILMKNFAARREFWFIDQVALFDMQSHLSGRGKMNIIRLDDVFGEKMEQRPESLLWTYTNEDKFKDNPMNRLRKELMEKYATTIEWNAMARGKYGAFVANKNDQFIGRSLLTVGSWCDHEIQYLSMMIDFGDTVLEIGSNLGSHTMPIAKLIGKTGRLYAMEPQRLMFQTMCANVAINSLSNVYAMNVACGEEEGVLHIGELDPNTMQNFGGFRPKEEQGELEVPVKTIDFLKLKDCKLIKLDIEGMELEAMKGGKDTLKNLEPILFFESHGDALPPIKDYLGTLGYTVYDFAIPNDPMYLAVTDKHADVPKRLNIKKAA